MADSIQKTMRDINKHLMALHTTYGYEDSGRASYRIVSVRYGRKRVVLYAPKGSFAETLEAIRDWEEMK